ncbi:MAG: AAA family ATPase [Fimbriiglobus sp.]
MATVPGNIAEMRAMLDPVLTAVDRVLIGRRALIERLLMALLTDGHVLIEGVPGLAKTLAVKTLAQALGLPFRRIQFTPDLLPADVLGTQIYNPRSGEFSIKQGPVFTNLLLADEINRAPAKVQSALLEAMQEHQVTIGETTFPLPKPFFVLATQNPIEQEGTYPLPEAQVDRFMLKVLLDYPTKADETAMLDRMQSVETDTTVTPQLTPETLAALRHTVDQIHMDDRIKTYIVDVVRATRVPKEYGLELAGLIQYGASPRATLALVRGAKANAFLHGRGFVLPEDVKSLALDVLRHRVMLTYEAEAEELRPDEVLKRVLDHLPVP